MQKHIRIMQDLDKAETYGRDEVKEFLKKLLIEQMNT